MCEAISSLSQIKIAETATGYGAGIPRRQAARAVRIGQEYPSSFGRRPRGSGGQGLGNGIGRSYSCQGLQLPGQDRGVEQWRHRPGVPDIPENPMFNMKPNSPIDGARYDRMMEIFGGKGFFVENPKDLKGTVEEAISHRRPALVDVVISQGTARKPQQFRWHS
jgi:hypothetical protein